MKIKKAGITIFLSLVLSGVLIGQTVSTGCGIGFWKNHEADWIPTGYSPSQTVAGVFVEAIAFPEIAASSLMQALSFHGGKGVEGGARLLIRQGVGALLNATHPDISFTRTAIQVITSVNGALSSNDSQTMRTLAESLELDNDRECGLKDGQPKVDIEKYTNGHNADAPSGPKIKVGDPVEWTYVVKNIGDVRLININVSDDQNVIVSCSKSILEPDESMTCGAQGTAVAGQYSNLGIVTAESEQGIQVSDIDPSHYIGVENITGEGCSLGYWKNHLESWDLTGYLPDQLLSGIFTKAALYPQIAAATLMEGLEFRGGSDVEGGARIMLRAAVAALLNAAHPDVDFPFLENEIINDVDAALASGDRTQMVSLFEDLDYNINLTCPLNGASSGIEHQYQSKKTKKKAKVNKKR